MSTTVSDYMTLMPHTIGNDISIRKAEMMMAQYNCHHLPVLAGGELVGIVSYSDLIGQKTFDDWDEVLVEDIMTLEPIIVRPETDVFQVATLMQQRRIGSVIVCATDETPWGIFTATDALRYLSENNHNKHRSLHIL